MSFYRSARTAGSLRLAGPPRPVTSGRPRSVLPALQAVQIGVVVAADLLKAVAAELFEEGVGEDDRHHGLAHDAGRRHRADVAPLDNGLDRLFGREVHRLERRAE